MSCKTLSTLSNAAYFMRANQFSWYQQIRIRAVQARNLGSVWADDQWVHLGLYSLLSTQWIHLVWFNVECFDSFQMKQADYRASEFSKNSFRWFIQIFYSLVINLRLWLLRFIILSQILFIIRSVLLLYASCSIIYQLSISCAIRIMVM